MNQHPGMIPIIRPAGASASLELIEGQLTVGLAVDNQGTLRLVTPDDLERWQTTVEALMPLAVGNMLRCSPRRGWQDIDDVPGLSVFVADDGQAASRMLVLEHLLSQWPAEGALVAVPSSEQLLVVPLHALESLEAFHIMVMAAHHAHQEGASPVSDQVYWFDGEDWHHIDVDFDDENVRLNPPQEFLRALERLATHDVVAAEA